MESTGVQDTMNPGTISEEAGETARTVVTALKSTPAILALVIFNLLFMGAVIYIQHTNGARWAELFELMLKQCSPK